MMVGPHDKSQSIGRIADTVMQSLVTVSDSYSMNGTANIRARCLDKSINGTYTVCQSELVKRVNMLKLV